MQSSPEGGAGGRFLLRDKIHLLRRRAGEDKAGAVEKLNLTQDVCFEDLWSKASLLEICS